METACLATWRDDLRVVRRVLQEAPRYNNFIGDGSVNDYNENIRVLIQITTDLISAADKGQAECIDENCMSLFGLAKDCGYRIRASAQREFSAHDEKYSKAG